MFLDTHAVVWLYAGDVDRFPGRARRMLENEPLFVSPIVLLEIQYLYELSRITQGATVILKELEKSLGLRVDSEEFERVVVAALAESWTRDPFDRMIVGHARLSTAALLTKDNSIQVHFRHAFWG